MTTMMDWNNVLRLPPAAITGKRVPKTALVSKTRMTKTEQKTLNAVARIEYYAGVQKSTTRIPPRIDDEHDIESIVFLRCTLTGMTSAYAEPARILHRCFPNPTVLLFERDHTVCISCAVTRKSLAEHNASVVESITMTGGFSPDDGCYTPLLEALAFSTLPQDDLYVYLNEFSWRIRLGRLIATLGFYPRCEPDQRDHLLELATTYDSLTAQRNAIVKQRRDGDLALNESAKLRMRQRTAERHIEATLTAIKEICHE